jgi:hypothetical protein
MHICSAYLATSRSTRILSKTPLDTLQTRTTTPKNIRPHPHQHRTRMARNTNGTNGRSTRLLHNSRTDKTFTDAKKPLHVLQNWDRFKNYHHKMIRHTLNTSGVSFGNTWAREKFSRNAMYDQVIPYLTGVQKSSPRRCIFSFGCRRNPSTRHPQNPSKLQFPQRSHSPNKNVILLLWLPVAQTRRLATPTSHLLRQREHDLTRRFAAFQAYNDHV